MPVFYIAQILVHTARSYMTKTDMGEAEDSQGCNRQATSGVSTHSGYKEAKEDGSL
jgi:hypothetical protein